MSRAGLILGILSFVTSGAITALLIPPIRRWALRHGFVDRPSAGVHKSHDRPVAFGGGIAITAGIIGPVLTVMLYAALSRRFPDPGPSFLTAWIPVWPDWMGGVMEKLPVGLAVVAGALVLHVLGLIDDHRPLSPRLKLTVQTAVALLLTAGFDVRALEVPLGSAAAVVLTTLWIVALTNAFNFLDNMDGLSSGLALITGVIMAACALQVGQVFVPCLALLIAGAAGGFLIYNFNPASIFMGDAGSLVLGYLLAVTAVLTTFYDPGHQQTPFGVFIPVVVFAVPLYDMVSVMLFRYRAGVSVFRGDRRHFSHRLVNRGLSPRSAVLTIYLATLATSLPALLLPGLSWAGAALVFGQCLCVVVLIAILEMTRGG